MTIINDQYKNTGVAVNLVNRLNSYTRFTMTCS